jgi:protein-S-isoprenylcysteine O-methyltransferase Ste14
VPLFRAARDAGPVANLVKTAGQIVVVWTFALVALPTFVVWIERRAGLWRWRWSDRLVVGVAILIAASAVGLASAWVMATLGRGTPVPFDAARELVIAGPYRVIRNPMATSAVVQIIGVAVIRGSPLTLALAVVSGVGWHLAMRPPEERFLAERFGPAYEVYRRNVRCWLPRWPPYSG